MLLVWGAVCIGVAAVVGGATGFGAALIATPFMLLAGYSVPEVVVINLVAGVVTRLGVALRLWDRIHWRRVALLVLGSVPGAWIGTLTLPWLPEHQLKQTVGVVVVLCGTGMALARFSRAYTPSADVQLLAGALSGYLSTTTSLNGPPVALLLTRANLPPLSFIADLAAYFTVTNVLSLLILLGGNAAPTDILWPALPLLVATAVLGNALGLRIARRLPVRGFRAAVIGLVILVGALTAVLA
jgi:uncharacterized membrane protein YfcA